MIKGIDTLYNGNYFRSRLEARWAVFFDEAKIKYVYELEGFVLEDGTKYLPDFYFQDWNVYCEVKPDMDLLSRDFYDNTTDISKTFLNHQDVYKWLSFAKEKPLLVLFGTPNDYTRYTYLKPLGEAMSTEIQNFSNILKEHREIESLNFKRVGQIFYFANLGIWQSNVKLGVKENKIDFININERNIESQEGTKHYELERAISIAVKKRFEHGGNH